MKLPCSCKMLKIPKHIISLHKFGGQIVPQHELQSKHWTAGMIELLGKPCRFSQNTDCPCWSVTTVNRVIDTPAFTDKLCELIAAKFTQLEITPLRPSDGLLYFGCEFLYDLNKYAKLGMFSNAEKNRFYELKSCFLQFLYTYRYVTSIVFETDTELFRFEIKVCGKTYTWHQPRNMCKHYVPESSHELSNKQDSNPPLRYGLHLMRDFKIIVLSVLLHDLKQTVTPSCEGVKSAKPF